MPIDAIPIFLDACSKICSAYFRLHLGNNRSSPGERRRLELSSPNRQFAVIESFRSTGDSILRQVDASARQSELLAKTRDALLPKLISGELRIPDAEKLLDEVGI